MKKIKSHKKVDWHWDTFNFKSSNTNWYLKSVRECFAKYIPSKSKVLEIGCGTGNILTHLSSVKKCQSYGIDLSSDALKVIKKYEKMRNTKVHFKVGDGFSVPYKANSFDCVYSEGVIEHFPDTEIIKMVKEHVRVCKRGGRVIISVPNKYNLPLSIAKFFLKEKYPHYPEKSHSIDELTAIVKKCGLTSIAQDGFAWQQGFAFWRFIKKIIYVIKFLPDKSLPPLLRSYIGHQCLIVAIKK